MNRQAWVCLVLLSTAAAVSSCTAEGTSPGRHADGNSSAQLNVGRSPGRQRPDRTETPPAAAAAAAGGRNTELHRHAKAPTGKVTPPFKAPRQATRVAGNTTAAAPTPAQPTADRQAAAAAGRTQQGDSAVRNARSRRLGLGAARRDGLRAAAARRLGQRLHARPAMHSRRTATAAHQPEHRTIPAAVAPPAAAPSTISTSRSSSSKSATTATAAASGTQQLEARAHNSSRLQAQKYFTITDLTGSKAIGVGETLTWREAQLLRPFADSASRPSDWQLIKVTAGSSNQQNDTGSEVYWVTNCGYLQWLKGRQEVTYTAELDSCSEVIHYAAKHKHDPQAPTQFGMVLIMIGVDNCLYSHCEHAGCGNACRCLSSASGECGCGRDTGFAPYYSWGQNRQSCAYNKLTVAAGTSSGNGDNTSKQAVALFEARRGSGNIVIPVRFFDTPTCLSQRASSRLKVQRVQCSRASRKADASRHLAALPAKRAAPTATAGNLQGGCNRADGTYWVVVEVPKQSDYYKCSVTFNDDWEDRPLAELRVT